MPERSCVIMPCAYPPALAAKDLAGAISGDLQKAGQMGNGFQFLDIILFAMVAAFLVLRLRNVLGKKTGHQRERQNPFAERSQEMNEDKVVELPNRRADDGAEPDFEDDEETAAQARRPDPAYDSDDDRLVAGIENIREADRFFDPAGFLEGANGAFEMIVRAFSAGELDRLQPLLAEDVFEQFRDAVEERARANETLETEITGISSSIVDAGMAGRDAVVTVCFKSGQINVTRDAENRIIDGDPNDVTEIEDIWTFRRDTQSADPNWKLVETGAQQ